MTKYSALVARALHAELGLGDDTMFLIQIENAFHALKKQQIETVLQVLNEALTADRGAITNLMAHRTPCNKALTDHPTIQTTWADVGPLGLINGIVEAITGRRIMAVYDDEICGGVQIARFELYPAAWQDLEQTRAADPTPTSHSP